MNKLSAQKGVISPLMIGGIVVLGIVVFLAASGTFKFSGSINKPASENSQVVAKPTEKPTEAPKPAVKLSAEPFTDEKLGFSISYPEGWKVKSSTTGINIFKSSGTKDSDQTEAILSVVNGTLGELKDTKLATIADLHKVYIKKQFGSVEFTGEKEIKIGSQDGYELKFTGSMNGENMQAKYTVIKSETNLFALVEIANTGIWKDVEAELDASVQSFKMQ